MEGQHPTRRIPLSILAGLSAVVLVAGGGTAWWTWNSIDSAQQPTPGTSASTRTQPDGVTTPTQSRTQPDGVTAQPQTTPEGTTAQPQDSSTAQVPVESTTPIYWLQDAGTHVELVTRTIEIGETAQPEVALEEAFNQLLAGPQTKEVATTIPAQTQLRSLSVESDGIHVDLSKEFRNGGGSTSMTGRLGQVIYTATTLDSAAPVWISVDGEPLKVLGGEGIVVNQPMTRTDFMNAFGSTVQMQ